MTPPSAQGSRRRQRSTRLVIASLLVLVAALGVAGTAVSGSWLAASLAGVLSVVLAAAVVRILWSEVIDSRRLAARDRAEQAKAYVELTVARTDEQAIYVAEASGRLARAEASAARLEDRLAAAAAELAEAHRLVEAERELSRTVVNERDRALRRLDDAEDRAAQAVVRVAELEQELDIVLSEWRAGANAPRRSHG